MMPTGHGGSHVSKDPEDGRIADRGCGPLLIFTGLASSAPPARTCYGKAATGPVGTSGNDVLIGTPGPDVIDGLGGDDLICGRADQDPTDVGDVLRGGRGHNRILAREGTDSVYGGDGTDGPDGNDAISEGPDRDTMQGNNGSDYVDAGEGNDLTVTGDDFIGPDGDGNDIVLGGSGNDLILSGGADADQIFGDAGNDGTGFPDGILSGSGNDYLEGGTGVDWADGDGGFGSDAGLGFDVCVAENEQNCEANPEPNSVRIRVAQVAEGPVRRWRAGPSPIRARPARCRARRPARTG